MKISLKKLPDGSITCQVNEALNSSETELLVRGVAKFLANGKTRVQIEMLVAVTAPERERIEKALKPQIDLASRLGGQIHFLAQAHLAQGVTPAELMEGELRLAQQEIHRLKDENLRLIDKIGELMALVSQPSTDAELRQAAEHYKKLSDQIEERKA